MTRGIRPTATRSAKAARPPVAVPAPARVRRRQKTARVTLSKGTTVREAAVDPRAAWSGAKPMWKKR